MGLEPSHFQVYRARFIEYLEDKPDIREPTETRAWYISDWIILKALAFHLFDYARGAEEVPDALASENLSPPVSAPWFYAPLGSAVGKHLKGVREYYAPLTVDKFSLVREIHSPQIEE